MLHFLTTFYVFALAILQFYFLVFRHFFAFIVEVALFGYCGYILRYLFGTLKQERHWIREGEAMEKVLQPMTDYLAQCERRYSEEDFQQFLMDRGMTYTEWSDSIHMLKQRLRGTPLLY